MPLHVQGFNFLSNNCIFIPVTWLTADVCHVNGTKHDPDLSSVGSYITFAPCKIFITMIVTLLYNTFKKENAIVFIVILNIVDYEAYDELYTVCIAVNYSLTSKYTHISQ